MLGRLILDWWNFTWAQQLRCDVGFLLLQFSWFCGTNAALFLRSVPFSVCTMYDRGEGEGVKTFPIRSWSRIQTVSPVFSLDSSLALCL